MIKPSHIYAFFGAGAVLVYLAVGLAMYTFSGKVNNVGKFNVPSEKIVKDLDGKVVPIMFNQAWPFDSSQNISLTIVSKKSSDEYVVVVVDLKALAAVQQPEIPSLPKEQFSTTPGSKDPPKPALPMPPKLPSKVSLAGKAKLTYELIDSDWYLINLENLTLRAVPID